MRILPAFAVAIFVATSAQAQTPISRELPEGVRLVSDLEYARYGDRVLKLDLYLPGTQPASPFVVVVVRGGGWRAGDKAGFGPMAAALAARGIPAASIEYRASGEAIFPAAVHDVKAAIRWLRANADTWGVHAEAVGITGGSAGAHLAALVGVTAGDTMLEGRGGSPGQSSRVQAVVALATPADLTVGNGSTADAAPEAFLGASMADDPELWAKASPVTHVSEESAPLLLIHSGDDGVVPVQQSLRLAERYAAAAVPVEVVLFPGAPHAFWNSREWFDDTMDRTASFFRRNLDPAIDQTDVKTRAFSLPPGLPGQ